MCKFSDGINKDFVIFSSVFPAVGRFCTFNPDGWDLNLENTEEAM